MQDRLSYELTFNSYGKVIVSTDNDVSYTVSDIHLEYDKITTPEMALTLKNKQKGKYSVLYDIIQRHGKLSLYKEDTIWSINLSLNTKSMKSILILFIDPNDGGGSYARDSETFYNPKINKVSVTLDGNPNQLYSSGTIKHQVWGEIRKHFADGKHRTVNTVAKELELFDMTLADYLTTKYGLRLDMRTTDDDSLHGSGRNLGKSSQAIVLQIEKDAEAAGALDAYVLYICDAQINFEKSRLVSTVFYFFLDKMFVNHAHSAVICGATGSDKTEYVLDLLEKEYKGFFKYIIIIITWRYKKYFKTEMVV